MDADGRPSTTASRDAASEPMKLSAPKVIFEAGFEISSEDVSGRLSADLEIDRARKGVGDRRPFLDVGHQRVDLGLGNAFAFHVDLDADVGEADRLLADVAGAPHRGDVEIALEFEFELVDGPAAVNRVGMQADRKAGA